MTEIETFDEFIQTVMRETWELFRNDALMFVMAAAVVMLGSAITLGFCAGPLTVGFIEADLVDLGSDAAVRRAIDAGAGNNVMSNIEMMRLVGELDSSNAWAVGRFDALANEARLPDELQSRMPAITWFSAAGHINGGLSGVFKAEAKDEESAKNLRDVLQGFLALAKLQAGDKPGMQSMVNSLQVSGEGKTVALAFAVPTEVLDLLEAAAKASRK